MDLKVFIRFMYLPYQIFSPYRCMENVRDQISFGVPLMRAPRRIIPIKRWHRKASYILLHCSTVLPDSHRSIMSLGTQLQHDWALAQSSREGSAANVHLRNYRLPTDMYCNVIGEPKKKKGRCKGSKRQGSKISNNAPPAKKRKTLFMEYRQLQAMARAGVPPSAIDDEDD